MLYKCLITPWTVWHCVSSERISNCMLICVLLWLIVAVGRCQKKPKGVCSFGSGWYIFKRRGIHEVGITFSFYAYKSGHKKSFNPSDLQTVFWRGSQIQWLGIFPYNFSILIISSDYPHFLLFLIRILLSILFYWFLFYLILFYFLFFYLYIFFMHLFLLLFFIFFYFFFLWQGRIYGNLNVQYVLGDLRSSHPS